VAKASIKTLNEVMRNPKIYAQTKALYSYLWVRADFKSGLAYPPKKQMQDEINLNNNMINEGLGVLSKMGYIKIGKQEGKDKDTQQPYIYTTYELIDKSVNNTDASDDNIQDREDSKGEIA
jgi:hypothetical protein